MNSRERSKSTEKTYVLWEDIENWCLDICHFLDGYSNKFSHVYGMHRGGLVPAVCLSHYLELPMLSRLTDVELRGGYIEDSTLVVDDVVDTGKTISKLFKPENQFVTLVCKSWSPKILYSPFKTDKWVVMPWEKE